MRIKGLQFIISKHYKQKFNRLKQSKNQNNIKHGSIRKNQKQGSPAR